MNAPAGLGAIKSNIAWQETDVTNVCVITKIHFRLCFIRVQSALCRSTSSRLRARWHGIWGIQHGTLYTYLYTWRSYARMARYNSVIFIDLL